LQGCHPAKHAGLALHPEPIAIALNDHRVAVVQEPVEDRRSENVVAEDLAPLPDELVGGDEKAALLVAASDELEEEMRRSLLEGQIAELVDDQELGLGVEGELVGELAVELGAGERTEQRGGAGEEYGMARLDDGASERDGEMSLAHARWPEEEHVFGLGDEAAGGELADEALVDRRLRLEVELVERLHGREMRDGQA